MASGSLWSPPTSTSAAASFFLSPLSPYDQQPSSGANSQLGCELPAPLLASSPVSANSRRRRSTSLMNNSLDLAIDVDHHQGSNNNNNNDVSSFYSSAGDSSDSGYFHNHQHNHNYPQRHAFYQSQPNTVNSRSYQPIMSTSQYLLSPVEGPRLCKSANSSLLNSDSTAGSSSNMTSTANLVQYYSYRTELLVSGQQATPWNHFTIVGQLRKLVNLNLIDASLIKQDNPPFDILTLVQKLVKYNLAVEMIDAEDEQLRQDQLAKVIKLRCEEVLAVSASIQELTQKRQAIHVERCRIRKAMKEIGAEIAMKTRKPENDKNIENSSVLLTPPPLLQFPSGKSGPNKPLISL